MPTNCFIPKPNVRRYFSQQSKLLCTGIFIFNRKIDQFITYLKEIIITILTSDNIPLFVFRFSAVIFV